MTVTQVPSQTSAIELAAADGSRTSLAITNTDAYRLYWLLGSGTPTSSLYSDYLDEGESVSFSGADIVSAIQGIWAGNGSGNANVTTNTAPVSDGNGAGISTYAQLKSAIAAWLRPNSAVTADMTTNIPRYVGMAETVIRRELHLRVLDQADADLEIEAGVAEVPTGFMATVSMSLLATPYVHIIETPLDVLMGLDQSETGDPIRFARSGSSFYFWPPTDSTAKLFFRRGVTPLSADGDTNWILAAHPDLYLSASLVVAARRLIDPRLGEFERWFAESLDSIKRLEINQNAATIYPMPSGFVV
jgi:hypothetical protein